MGYEFSRELVPGVRVLWRTRTLQIRVRVLQGTSSLATNRALILVKDQSVNHLPPVKTIQEMYYDYITFAYITPLYCIFESDIFNFYPKTKLFQFIPDNVEFRKENVVYTKTDKFYVLSYIFFFLSSNDCAKLNIDLCP